MFAATSQATVVTTTDGSTTTFSENFDGTTSFLIQYFNSPSTTPAWSGSFVSTVGTTSAYSGDGYLNLGNGIAYNSGNAMYTFSANTESTATLDFLYAFSANDSTNRATVSIDGTSVNLENYAGTTAYVNLNPGPNSSASASFAFTPALQTFSLGAGQHTLQFGISGSRAGLKVDDLTMTVTPVPEPETYGMMIAGLGLIAVIARRKKASE
jgi:hypothetical protein